LRQSCYSSVAKQTVKGYAAVILQTNKQQCGSLKDAQLIFHSCKNPLTQPRGGSTDGRDWPTGHKEAEVAEEKNIPKPSVT